MPAIAWRPWCREAFDRARIERKPVLLSIAATWCRNCAEMDRTSYADAAVAALVNGRFVPVRVDPDRRPDVGRRYGLGGWPTTAFLTPDGEVIGGGTYVTAPRLLDVLQRVQHAFDAGRHEHAGRTPRPAVAPAGPPPAVDALIAQVLGTFDQAHGGFGGVPKFPLVAPVRLAMTLHQQTGAAEFREMAVRSLDAMGWGPLYDERDGGFFSYAQEADWGAPNREKLLDVNAALLTLYIDASEAFGLARYAERAEGVLQYVQTWLADPVDGGWGASQYADNEYYGRPPDHDDPAEAPAVDRTQYADWNASMASAALQAGGAFHDPGLSEFAIRSLERLVLQCYRPGQGMAHYVDDGPPVRGLIDDQIAMANSHLDAHEATGNIVYRMMAEELALYAIGSMWDEREGGFVDRIAAGEEIGLLREPHKPFASNCAAARMLRRLAASSGNETYETYAGRTLTAIGARAAAEGPLAADYLLAVGSPVHR